MKIKILIIHAKWNKMKCQTRGICRTWHTSCNIKHVFQKVDYLSIRTAVRCAALMCTVSETFKCTNVKTKIKTALKLYQCHDWHSILFRFPICENKHVTTQDSAANNVVSNKSVLSVNGNILLWKAHVIENVNLIKSLHVLDLINVTAFKGAICHHDCAPF